MLDWEGLLQIHKTWLLPMTTMTHDMLCRTMEVLHMLDRVQLAKQQVPRNVM